MTRESIYEDGELAASFCPTDVPLSDKGREALEAVVRAVRKDMAAGPGPQLGTCTVCVRELRLTRAGVIWSHRDRADWRGKRCDGAGKPPRAASVASTDTTGADHG